MYNEGNSCNDISKKYNCHYKTVLHVVRLFGKIRTYDEIVKLRPKSHYDNISKFQKYDKDWIELYKNGSSCMDIAKIYNCSGHTVNNHIKRSGITRSHQHGRQLKYDLVAISNNHTYFNTIDIEGKAYWLGFLLADGSVLHRGNATGCVELNLMMEDGYHVEKFASIFHENTRVKSYSRGSNTIYSVSTQVFSRILFNRLIEIGILPNKSYIDSDEVFNHIPNYLMNHFIRGYMDGDGSIYRLKKNGSPWIAFYGTYNVLLRISSILSNLPVRINKIHPDDRSPTAFRIMWGAKSDVISIIHYLYDNATIYLERKKKKADEILAVYGGGSI